MVLWVLSLLLSVPDVKKKTGFIWKENTWFQASLRLVLVVNDAVRPLHQMWIKISFLSLTTKTLQLYKKSAGRGMSDQSQIKHEICEYLTKCENHEAVSKFFKPYHHINAFESAVYALLIFVCIFLIFLFMWKIKNVYKVQEVKLSSFIKHTNNNMKRSSEKTLKEETI